MPQVLLIENCDFDGYPAGGQLSFAKNMMKAFGSRLALVGVCTDSTPVGRWIERTIGTQKFQFFGVHHASDSNERKPFIPLRLRYYLAMKKYIREVRSLGVKNVFVQAAEAMLVLAEYDWDSLCYCFPGVKNEIEFSRYRWARLFKNLYERKLFKALEHASVILACADENAIAHLINRSNGRLKRTDIVQFPTRVDTGIFFPEQKMSARSALGIQYNERIIVSCGRIRQIKGWDLILQAFKIAQRRVPNIKLIFVGDGEDKPALEAMSHKLRILDSVEVTGAVALPQVARYLNAADLFVVGSHHEGWSLAMLEALACGKPIVSADVSGARQMIKDGQNGYIIPDRDPMKFADAMIRSLELENASKISLTIASEYSVADLPQELGKLWPPLA